MKRKKRILSFGLAVCCFVGLLGINTQKVKGGRVLAPGPGNRITKCDCDGRAQERFFMIRIPRSSIVRQVSRRL